MRLYSCQWDKSKILLSRTSENIALKNRKLASFHFLNLPYMLLLRAQWLKFWQPSQSLWQSWGWTPCTKLCKTEIWKYPGSLMARDMPNMHGMSYFWTSLKWKKCKLLPLFCHNFCFFSVLLLIEYESQCISNKYGNNLSTKIMLFFFSKALHLLLESG